MYILKSKTIDITRKAGIFHPIKSLGFEEKIGV
jgi:hypothetical protein